MSTIFKILRNTLCIPFAFIFWSAFAQSCNDNSLTYNQLKDNLEVQLELLVNRELSEAELERATKEYYALFNNNCDSLCKTVVEYNNDMVIPMQERPGEPMDLLRRHYYSSALYYSPRQYGSFIQQLTNEIDPIKVADPKSKRILKHSDILGILNIDAFVKNGGPPKTKTFDPETIDAVVEEYRKYYSSGIRKLPHRLGLAAELWAGMKLNWDRLSNREQQQVQDYFDSKSETPIMDEATYIKLLGLTSKEAEEWRSQDSFEHGLARLDELNNQIIDHYTKKTQIEILWGRW